MPNVWYCSKCQQEIRGDPKVHRLICPGKKKEIIH